MKSRLLLSILVFFLVQNISAQIIYVNMNASGTNDGSNWANAYVDLQDALSAATSGDTIVVASGTYKPSSTDRSVSFSISDGIKIFGGFAGDETNFSLTTLSGRDFKGNATILSGDINGDDGSEFSNYSDNSYHVVKFSPDAGDISDETILDGFTISGGNSDGTYPDNRGGGIYFDNSTNKTSSPFLRSLIVMNNLAVSGGGIAILPIYGDAAINPVFINLMVIENKATGDVFCAGGGLYIFASSPVLYNAAFIGNTVEATGTACGGAIYNFSQNTGETANMKIVNGLFEGNYSSHFGGGIYNRSGSSDGLQTSVTEPTLTNCTFYNNQDGSSTLGKAIMNIEYNSSTCHVTIQNSILWNNGSYQVTYHYSDDGRPSVTFKNCVVQNSDDVNFETRTLSTNNENLYTTDPLFADSDALNFRTEHFTNSGNNDFLPIDTYDLDGDGDLTELIPYDIEGAARILEGTVAIGAFETKHDQTPPSFSSVILQKNIFSPGDSIIISAELTESGAIVSADLSNLDSDFPSDALFSESEPGVYTYTTTPFDEGGNMQEGTYKVYITAEDITGNATVDSSQVVILDKTQPVFNSVDVGEDTTFRSEETITFTIDMGEKNLHVYADLSVIDGSFSDSIVFIDNTDGTYSYTTEVLNNSGEMTVGSVNVFINAMDEAGNFSVYNSLWLVLKKIDGYFVKASATGTNDGSSWDNAFTKLQDALSIAKDGDKILVAAGTYRTESNLDRSNSFLITKKIEVYGGFTGDEEEITQEIIDDRDWETNETILSGDGNGDDETDGDNSENSYHVVDIENEVLIDGFTIRDGNANGIDFGQDLGGGIYTYEFEFTFQPIPTISNCKIINNSSETKAGGIYIYYDGFIDHCLIAGNTAENGGGIYQGDRYGDLLITNTSICNNTATDLGGGFNGFSYYSDNACIASNTIIAFNKAGNSSYRDIGGYISASYSLIGPYVPRIKDQGNNIICEEKWVNEGYIVNYPVEFVDTAALNYSLYAYSELIGAGDPTYGNNIGFYQGAGVTPAEVPNILIISTIAEFESTKVGGTSSEQSFSISGENLYGDVNIIPPSGFEVSLASGTSFIAEDTIKLAATDHTVDATTIHVRFAPTVAKNYNDSIKIETKLYTAYVKVSGNTGTQVNAIIAAEGTLFNFYTTSTSEASSVQYFSVSGNNLEEDIKIEAPEGFELSLVTGDVFYVENPILLGPTENQVEPTNIFVRFNPSEEREYQDSIEVTISSDTIYIPVHGYVQSQINPMIFIEGTLAEFDSTSVGQVSTEQSFSVSGINLEGAIYITPPDGFEISTTSGEEFSAENSIVITPEENTVNEVDIFVRFAPEENKNYSDTIKLTSASAEQAIVKVSGAVKSQNSTDIKSILSKKDDFEVYPNPSSDFIFIQLHNKTIENNNISIFSFGGKLIFTEKSQSEILKIDISTYQPGIYIVKVNDAYKKLIIQ